MTLKESFAEYLKKFRPREEGISLEARLDANEVIYNNSAYEDLEMETFKEALLGQVPNLNDYNNAGISRIIATPSYDKETVIQRRDVIDELFHDKDLYQRVTNVKIAGDAFAYKRKFQKTFEDSKVQKLETTKLFVDLIDSINDNLKGVSNERLKQIKEFGEKVSQDKGFQNVKTFVKEVYNPANLGENLAEARYNLYHGRLEEISNRRQFYNTTNLTQEATTKIIGENGVKNLKGFLNNEAEAVKLLNTIKKKSDEYHSKLFEFEGGLSSFQRNNNGLFFETFSYWLDLFGESIDSQLLKANIQNLPEELGFYLGGAGLLNKWDKKGIPIIKPNIREKEERRTEIRNSYNSTLIEDNINVSDKHFKSELQSWSKQENDLDKKNIIEKLINYSN